MNSVCTVVVTFNRLHYLKQVINALKHQSHPTDIIIVNNGSTDGTTLYLDSIQGIKVINQDNVGGSGGFHTGIKEALASGYEYIWVMDDDAIPDVDALQWLMKYKNLENVSAITSTVYNKNGKIDLTHRCVIECDFKHKFVPVSLEKYSKEYFEIDIFSYVGTLLKASKLKEVGLPIKNFFIFYDDTEHSLRMRKVGKIYNISRSIINHQTADVSPKRMKSHWKIPFQYRNKLYSYKKHFPKECFLYHYLMTVGKGVFALFCLKFGYSHQIFKALYQFSIFREEV